MVHQVKLSWPELSGFHIIFPLFWTHIHKKTNFWSHSYASCIWCDLWSPQKTIALNGAYFARILVDVFWHVLSKYKTWNSYDNARAVHAIMPSPSRKPHPKYIHKSILWTLQILTNIFVEKCWTKYCWFQRQLWPPWPVKWRGHCRRLHPACWALQWVRIS